jgi:hypothetical protein
MHAWGRLLLCVLQWSLLFSFCMAQNRIAQSWRCIWWLYSSVNAFLYITLVSFLGVGWDWVHLARRPLIGLLYQPRMIDDDKCGAVGMRIGRENRSTRRKRAPMPLCPPQIPHDLTWTRTRAATVGSRRPTAWAMARPKLLYLTKRRLKIDNRLVRDFLSL